jgi:hypothetical protein
MKEDKKSLTPSRQAAKEDKRRQGPEEPGAEPLPSYPSALFFAAWRLGVRLFLSSFILHPSSFIL